MTRRTGTSPDTLETPEPPAEPSARETRIETIFRRGVESLRRDYDPERGLVAGPGTDPSGARTHRPPQSLWLARALLRSGDPAGAEEAAALIAVVLETQERTPEHPHRGNFRWLADDREVTDLNAVQFLLRALLPLLLEHGGALPAPLLDHCRTAVRLALEEEARLAVAPTYTNIHLMSLFALLSGGEWLGDGDFSALGRERWDAWVAFTAASGAPHEYNSPNYGLVDLSALAAVRQHVSEQAVRRQARLFYERLWLHLALRLHVPTGQHAGPHCRCYWPAMTGGRSGLHDLLWRETGWSWLLDPGPDGGEGPASVELALTAHTLPDTLRAWLDPAAAATREPFHVRETANGEAGADLTTYLTPEYALGSASRTYRIGTDDYYIEHQANALLLHYRRPARPLRPARRGRVGPETPEPAGPAGPGWGMVYSRYVVNDRHWGTLAAAPDRPATMNFYDQGEFAGAQQGGRAIALYALQPQPEPVHSLKTVVAFPPIEALDEVWVDGRRVGAADLPRPLRPGEWVVVADGDVYVGVRPLEPTRLGREEPLLLLERGPQARPELWLTAYNFRGPAKRFWEYASLGGAFWRGNLRAGYVLEVHPRTAFQTAAALFDRLRRATIRDTVEATPASPALRTVTFTSGRETLQLQLDLWRTAPGERRIDGAVYSPPALESPLAVQGSSGRLRVGGATLETDPVPVWLIAGEVGENGQGDATEPRMRTWIAVNPQAQPTPLRLETPVGVVSAGRWDGGRLELRVPAAPGPGERAGPTTLRVDAPALPEGLRVPAGVTVVLTPPGPE